MGYVGWVALHIAYIALGILLEEKGYFTKACAASFFGYIFGVMSLGLLISLK